MKCPICGAKKKSKYSKTCGKKECVTEYIRRYFLKKYGVENPSQSEAIKEKRKQTFLKKYGVENPFQLDSVRQKAKQTLLERYGVDNALKSDSVKEKVKKTCLLKYGTESPLQNEQVKEKVRQTNLKKYGVPYTFQSEEIRKKGKETLLKKYGVDNISKLKVISEIKRFKETEKFLPKLKEYCDKNDLIFLSESYIGVWKDKNQCIANKYKFKCKKCGYEFESTLRSIIRCPRCSGSNEEKELINFLEENNNKVVVHDRSILDGKELDIFIPDKNLAIELNGLFWHSELNGNKDRNYHLNKTILCEQKGIHLIQIFEDEWLFRKDIVKSILLAKLGLLKNKIYARTCNIKNLSYNEVKEFLQENHLQADIKAKLNIGLFYNNELVSLLCLGKPRFNKNYEWEILRFCNKNYYLVIGAFSKLLNYFIENYNPKSIISYVDRRYGTGHSLKKLGFKLIGTSKPNYFYIKVGEFVRYPRENFQKHKLAKRLEKFDESKSEWINMIENGYDRIWDCGNFIYVLN